VIRRLNQAAIALVVPVVLVALWWVLSANSASPYFPPLQDLLRSFKDTWNGDALTTNVLPSVVRLFAGFAIAIVVGVSGGILLGLSPRARRDLRPVTEYFRATPVAALVPLALVLFGAGAKMEIILIAFASTWPILVATADGVRGADPLMLEMARVYGLSSRQRIRTITLPAALPQIMAGIRIATAIAVATMVIANMFGSSAGLGYFVVTAQQSFDIQGTWTGLFMIGLIGSVVTGLLLLAQRRLLAWHRGWRAAAKEGA
jgi:ABC-type nitrate/sulfonate/bicarbonate transport system permease component